MKTTRKRLWRKIAIWGTACFIVLAASTAGVGWHFYRVYAQALPTESAIANWHTDEATRIYDRNGKLLYEVYGTEKRVVVPSDAIAPVMKQAVVAVEDRRFYEHKGVDPKGLLRAIVHNVKAQGYVEGGSTITQQLAKNTFLSSDRTIDRKAKELLLALKLERHYTKDQIITLYLNEVGFGGNAYGVEAASEMYFNKSAKDLSVAEAATLAALIKSPSTLSPYSGHTDKLIARRNMIIMAMARNELLPPQVARTAQSTELAVKPREEKILAPHFVMYVRQILVDRYGEEALEKGGYEVTTTLDLDKQKMAEDVIQQSDPVLAKANAQNAALVGLDPKTGEILAMVGSRNYFDTHNDGNVNVTTRPRPPGSAFKPIVYGAGFEKGWAPGSTLFDLETNLGDEKHPYEPKNYDNKVRGPQSIRSALALSLNITAVKMLSLVGTDTALATAKQLGITSLSDPSRYGLSLVLGGGDVPLLELSGAYGAFANEGVENVPTGISKIKQHGQTVYEYKPEPKPVFRSQTAYQISSILSDNQARTPMFGPHSPLVVDGHTVAVKTGTTQDYRDAWTVGYTPSYVVGVWVGNNDFSPMRTGSAGAMAAAPIWHAYFERLLANQPDEPFRQPSDLQMVTVDALTGKPPTPATRETRQDMFAPWQLSTSSVQLVSYKIFDCTGTVKEEKRLSVVHSERPDNPRWEAPVQSWAAAHGYGGTRGVSDVHEECAPAPVELAAQPPQGVGGADVPALPTPDPTPVPSPSPEPTPTPSPSPEPTPSPSESPSPSPSPPGEVASQNRHGGAIIKD